MKHSLTRDRKTIAYHYDVGNDFYNLFLDDNKIYSCAYFIKKNDSLNQAQLNKLDYICQKLRLTKTDTLLDIGCGWGGLIIHAAKQYGVKAVGITLSLQQYRFSSERIKQAGLESDCEIYLCDYRNLPKDQQFNKIASIGMIEHVGLKQMPQYFSIVKNSLKDQGLFLNQGITSAETKNLKGTGSKFMDKLIFPDAELINISLMGQLAEKAGFEILNIESLRKHYALTLRQWVKRLQNKKNEALTIVKEQTYRTWLLYMAGCIEAFKSGQVNLYQTLLTKRNNAFND